MLLAGFLLAAAPHAAAADAACAAVQHEARACSAACVARGDWDPRGEWDPLSAPVWSDWSTSKFGLTLSQQRFLSNCPIQI